MAWTLWEVGPWDLFALDPVEVFGFFCFYDALTHDLIAPV